MVDNTIVIIFHPPPESERSIRWAYNQRHVYGSRMTWRRYAGQVLTVFGLE